MEISYGMLSGIYNLMLLTAIFAFINKNSNKEREQWYKYLIVLLFLVVIAKLMSESHIYGGIFNFVSVVGTFFLFAITPFLGCVMIKYVYDCMNYAKEKGNRLLIIYIVFSVINLLLLLISQIFSLGIFYSFDGMKYNKGNLYDVRTILIAIEYISMQLYIIYMSKKNKHEFSMALWLFPMYTILITGFQFLINNMTHDYTDMLFYSILLYIYMQSIDLNTDFLTGAVNRRKFDAELNKRISNSSEAKFSGIMVDIDRFKFINDNYGHQAGDDALEAFSSLVIKNFRKTEVVARYGGDEFCVLTNIYDENEIELAISRLRKSVEKFNASRKLPFDISLSLGYAIYDCEKDGSSSAFLKRLDEKMYQEKEIHHREAEIKERDLKGSL